MSPEVSSPRLLCTPVADPEVKVEVGCVLPGFDGGVCHIHTVCQTCSAAMQGGRVEDLHYPLEELFSLQYQGARAARLEAVFLVSQVCPALTTRDSRWQEEEAKGLSERLKRWNEGQVDVLWAEARKLFSGCERQALTNSMASNIRRATECAQDARYGKASSFSWLVSRHRGEPESDEVKTPRGGAPCSSGW